MLIYSTETAGGHGQCNLRVPWEMLYQPTLHGTAVESAETEKLLLLSLKKHE